MKTVIEMARDQGLPETEVAGVFIVNQDDLGRFAELARADEREQIAKMIEGAPPLVELAQNEHGGCLMCGFMPKLAAATIRARSNT